MKRLVRLLAGLLIVGLLPGCAAVTTGSLLDDMTDLRRLAELPSPSYTTKQFSSYDRKSTTPADHENWFANHDAGQFIRVEKTEGRDEHVMMDADGPGAIVRIWSANPKGTLRVYLDRGPAPVIEARMDELLGGKTAEFPEPIAGERSRGWNLYFPIPYSGHCKVTSDDGGFYYHVNYRTYPAGTKVVTFSREDLKALKGRIEQVAAALRSPRAASAPSELADKRPMDAALSPGGEAILADLAGPRAIRAMQLQLAAKDVDAAARGVVLYMSFDGQQTVECPLGDFFGTAPGLSPYESLPMGITQGDRTVMWSHWCMPFARSAQIRVKNLGTQEVKILGGLTTTGYHWSERSLLFHAKWRIERDVPSRPFSDWTHLECQGHGRFVGGAFYICNPVRDWWGEGDEKIYLDDEAFPSFFGTGAEDYYGYAWCNPELFVHAYHTQTRCDGPRNFGHTAVSRFHILDDVPFRKRFKFDIENWHSNKATKTDRAAVSYWYARPGGTDFFKPITAADAAPPRKMVYQVQYTPGAIEGEKMREITVPGNCRIENVGPQASGEEHLWWEKGKPGDKLVLGFEAPAGRKRVVVRLCQNNNYAMVQLYINDVKAGEVMDLYAPKYKPMDEIDLGEFELKNGENRLAVEIVGINDKARKNYEFAIDYLKLK
ncbi:MAG TPA: DUF2961 domain-containing protein [Phycisphaerae bacterium]|nr:DUF2961 domain-containing protein [Phycisphaerae bacterium]